MPDRPGSLRTSPRGPRPYRAPRTPAVHAGPPVIMPRSSSLNSCSSWDSPGDDEHERSVPSTPATSEETHEFHRQSSQKHMAHLSARSSSPPATPTMPHKITIPERSASKPPRLKSPVRNTAVDLPSPYDDLHHGELALLLSSSFGPNPCLDVMPVEAAIKNDIEKSPRYASRSLRTWRKLKPITPISEPDNISAKSELPPPKSPSRSRFTSPFSSSKSLPPASATSTMASRSSSLSSSENKAARKLRKKVEPSKSHVDLPKLLQRVGSKASLGRLSSVASKSDLDLPASRVSHEEIPAIPPIPAAYRHSIDAARPKLLTSDVETEEDDSTEDDLISASARRRRKFLSRSMLIEDDLAFAGAVSRLSRCPSGISLKDGVEETKTKLEYSMNNEVQLLFVIRELRKTEHNYCSSLKELHTHLMDLRDMLQIDSPQSPPPIPKPDLKSALSDPPSPLRSRMSLRSLSSRKMNQRANSLPADFLETSVMPELPSSPIQNQYQDTADALLALLSHLPRLISLSDELSRRLSSDPTAWGVATAFLALHNEIRAAFIPWAVTSQHFVALVKGPSAVSSHSSLVGLGLSGVQEEGEPTPAVLRKKTHSRRTSMDETRPSSLAMTHKSKSLSSSSLPFSASSKRKRSLGGSRKAVKDLQSLLASDIIIQPIQRLTRYPLFLKQMLSKEDKFHREHSTSLSEGPTPVHLILQQASDDIASLAAEVNDNLSI